MTRSASRALQSKGGRPKQQPEELIVDNTYDSRRFRSWLRRRGTKSTIPSYERHERKRPKRGRRVKVGLGYEERWKVERTFSWLGSFRLLLVRHERHLCTFRAFFLLTFVIVLLRHL